LASTYVELEMKAAGIIDFGSDLKDPDFARLADAAGLVGLTAETPGNARLMIAHALVLNTPKGATEYSPILPANTLFCCHA
jgi:pyruvate dehydrogenase (quinone)